MCLHPMFASFLSVVHMELCKLMRVVISTLKSCSMEIAQQSDAIWKMMVHS
jgi:hypothetical protein